MSYYYSLRGWLEIAHECLPEVVKRIQVLQETYLEDEKLSLYMKGWCWKETPINWTTYVFYGADVTIEGLDLFDSVLQNIVSAELQISGYFHAQGEDGERNFTYSISDDRVSVKESSALIDIS